MTTRTQLRTIGAIILFFNLWLIGTYNLPDLAVLLLTFGFAIGFELWVVRKFAPAPKDK